MTKEQFLEKFKEFSTKGEFFADNIDESWYPIFVKLGPQIKIILEKLGYLRRLGEIHYPLDSLIFRVFKECPLSDLKVIILGQDPYPNHMATGLAFDNTTKTTGRISPSLDNIFKELDEDLIYDLYKDTERYERTVSKSYLSHLPKQGVFLLNTALTVKEGEPNSHKEIWTNFTQSLIEELNKIDNIIWVLWGANALAYKTLVNNTTHKFIISSHPSPLAYKKPLKNYPKFEGSKPFSQVNLLLKEMGKSLIQW